MASPVGRGLRRLALELANMCALLVGVVVVLATGAGAAIAAAPGGPVRGVVVIVCALYLNLVIHESGHFLAARLAGVPITAIEIGGPPYLATIRLGHTRLGHTRLGLGVWPRGRVRLARLPDVGRSAAILATGPLASLLVAGVVLPAPGPHWLTRSVAVIFGGLGLMNLVPYTGRGQMTDGARLLALPARHAAEKDLRRLTAEQGWEERPGAADRMLAAYRRGAVQARNHPHVVASLLRRHERTGDLLTFHKQPFLMSGSPAQATVNAVGVIEWAVVTVPGLPRPAADLAAQRIEWVIGHLRGGPGQVSTHVLAAQHTLAVARLRQRRFAEVEPLCSDALAATSLTASERATVLATVAMARHALGQDGHTPLQQAHALNPVAELVSEARDVIQEPVPPGRTPSAPAT